MAKRCSGRTPPESIRAAAVRSPLTNASRTAAWMSASAGMATLVRVFAKAIRFRRLSRQHVQGWQIVVPLNERRLRAKSANRVGVQVPGRFGYRLGMRVHEERGARRRLVFFRGEAAEMEFGNGRCRELVDKVVGVVAHVVAAQIDVAD